MDRQFSTLDRCEEARNARFRWAVWSVGGLSRVSALTGQSEDEILGFCKGGKAPSAVMEKVAKAANCSLIWLLTGIEAQIRSAPSRATSDKPANKSRPKRLAPISKLDPVDGKFWDKLTSRVISRAEARRG